LLHVGYKIAAKKGDRYYDQLVACEESISRNVTTNLYDRHLKPLFASAAYLSFFPSSFHRPFHQGSVCFAAAGISILAMILS